MDHRDDPRAEELHSLRLALATFALRLDGFEARLKGRRTKPTVEQSTRHASNLGDLTDHEEPLPHFDEVLRVIDSLQLGAKHKVATPVNWKQGDDVIIAGSVTDDDAKKLFPQGWKAPKPHIRIVPQPRG